MSNLRKIWDFIWKSNSIWSWVINIILAFIIVKFLIYPGLGLILGTTHPVVAVVSSSMHHDQSFNSWFDNNKDWYVNRNMTKADFEEFPMKNGFNKGDIIILTKPSNIRLGDIIVFRGNSNNPIIHRVVGLNPLQTKGDNNPGQYQVLGETNINDKQLIGKARFKLPWLGWVKITAACGLTSFKGNGFTSCMKTG